MCSVEEIIITLTLQARETVREYDKATHGLEGTIKETSELEKRANLAGIELVKAMEKLSALRNETKDYEHKRSKQEKLLKDITHVSLLIIQVWISFQSKISGWSGQF